MLILSFNFNKPKFFHEFKICENNNSFKRLQMCVLTIKFLMYVIKKNVDVELYIGSICYVVFLLTTNLLINKFKRLHAI